MVPEVAPLDMEPSVLVVAPVVPLPEPLVGLDIEFGPEPIVPLVAGAPVVEVWAKAKPEQAIEMASVAAMSLRDIESPDNCRAVGRLSVSSWLT
jgi:hypothetical protein